VYWLSYIHQKSHHPERSEGPLYWLSSTPAHSGCPGSGLSDPGFRPPTQTLSFRPKRSEVEKPLYWLSFALALTLFLATASAEKPRKQIPPLPAQQYPLHETHPADHLTIAAEPGDTKETAPHTRLDYYSHGFLPIRVIVTNDSDLAINLDDARIHFIAADGSSIPAATDDALERGMFTLKSATGRKVPLPLPIPITTGKSDINKKVVADDNDFSFQTTTVAPHTTVAGYLFYDINNLDTPILDHATLELRKVRLTSTNKILDTFEIPLSKPTTADTKDEKRDPNQ